MILSITNLNIIFKRISDKETPNSYNALLITIIDGKYHYFI